MFEDLPRLQVIEDDPDDDVILACAVSAKADYIVSGDRHLRALGAYEDIKIVSPVAFADILQRDSS